MPVIGPLAAEVVDTLIPNQRLDRIEDFLQKLDEKINELELSSIESSFRAPEFIDLFEDGMYQAARSLSDKKKEYIACILKNSLTTNRINWIQDKKLLSILSEVNDIEILTLTDFALDGQERKSFLKKHKEVLLPPDDVDRITIYETPKPTLNRLGLLRTTEAAGQDGNIEERDPVTAKVLPFQYELTPLGALLLKRIDIITSSEGADYTLRK